MAAEDANFPTDLRDQEKTLRYCEKCNAVMKQLAVLPALSMHTALKVFRCYACDHVVSDRN